MSSWLTKASLQHSHIPGSGAKGVAEVFCSSCLCGEELKAQTRAPCMAVRQPRSMDAVAVIKRLVVITMTVIVKISRTDWVLRQLKREKKRERNKWFIHKLKKKILDQGWHSYCIQWFEIIWIVLRTHLTGKHSWCVTVLDKWFSVTTKKMLLTLCWINMSCYKTWKVTLTYLFKSSVLEQEPHNVLLYDIAYIV